STSPPPPTAAAEHQDGHAGHAARQRVDDGEQNSASQPSPRPPVGNSAGQPMQSSIRAAQHGRGGPGGAAPLVAPIRSPGARRSGRRPPCSQITAGGVSGTAPRLGTPLTV